MEIHLAIAADEQPAFARVNTETGKRVDFDLLLDKSKFSEIQSSIK